MPLSGVIRRELKSWKSHIYVTYVCDYIHTYWLKNTYNICIMYVCYLFLVRSIRPDGNDDLLQDCIDFEEIAFYWQNIQLICTTFMTYLVLNAKKAHNICLHSFHFLFYSSQNNFYLDRNRRRTKYKKIALLCFRIGNL